VNDEMDIVKWLRLHAHGRRLISQYERADMLEAAANEIERLRNLLAEADR